jgi:hypothetical protein
MNTNFWKFDPFFFILKRTYEESIDMDCFLMNNLFMYIEVFIEQYSDLKYVFV